MARRQSRRNAYTIYRDPNGGWCLTSTERQSDDGSKWYVVLYRINGANDAAVFTETARLSKYRDGIDHKLRRLGAELGPYEGSRPEPNTRFADQPRAVRMQRHATDIYDTLGHVRGMSPTIAVRAAEEFGSTWRDKEFEDWFERVRTVGEGRASRIHEALHE